MKRTAPKGGYDFGSKRDYRRAVWGGLRDCISAWTTPDDAQIALMPSAEGKEIEVVESMGFRRENMHVIDRNPAIVATLQRRFPGINTYGVEARYALSRMAKNGVRIDAANLDFCGCVGSKILHEITVCSCTGAFLPKENVGRWSAVAVTVLRGREYGQRWDRLRGFVGDMTHDDDFVSRITDVNISARPLTDMDVLRVVGIASALNHVGSVHLDRLGLYKSTAGNQTMLWGVYNLGLTTRMFREMVITLASAGRATKRKTRNSMIRQSDLWKARFRAAVARAIIPPHPNSYSALVDKQLLECCEGGCYDHPWTKVSFETCTPAEVKELDDRWAAYEKRWNSTALRAGVR